MKRPSKEFRFGRSIKTFRCELHKKEITISFCQYDCWMEKEDLRNRYKTRAMCKLNHIDYLSALERIKQRYMVRGMTEDDLLFIKNCKISGILIQSDGGGSEFSQEGLEFARSGIRRTEVG